MIEHFDAEEMATLVGLVANLEDDPDSEDIIDRTIRRCRKIALDAGAPLDGRQAICPDCGGEPHFHFCGGEGRRGDR